MNFKRYLTVFLLSLPFSMVQAADHPEPTKVVVSGDKLAFPLLEEWIKEYESINPGCKILLDEKLGLKADVFVQSGKAEKSKDREYFAVARYVILPVANASSEFSANYSLIGLNEDQLKQVFFNDIFAEKKKKEAINIPYTVYSRMSGKGLSTLFAAHFGYSFDQIKGNAVVGSENHVIKAVAQDITAITFNSPHLVYNLSTGQINEGLAVIPIDLNGNGKVTDDEKIYDNLGQLIAYLETQDLRKIKTLPVVDLNLSVNHSSSNDAALKFLAWVLQHGQGTANLHGFLKAEETNDKG